MKKKIILSIAILLGVGFAGAAAFYFFGPGKASLPSFMVPDEVYVPREVPPGYKEYLSHEYRFSLLYQEVMDATEFTESGAKIITFENTDPDNLIGFQVYAASYSEGDLTEEFIKQHVGGAHTFESVVVDGATGIAFVSSDLALGELREVWFVHRGYLYQTATARPLESLLHEALQTWQFIP